MCDHISVFPRRRGEIWKFAIKDDGIRIDPTLSETIDFLVWVRRGEFSQNSVTR